MKPRTLVLLFIAGGLLLLGILFALDVQSRKPRLRNTPETVQGRTPAETTELRRRAEKDVWFANSADSPLPEPRRTDFTGLPYYDYNPAWILPAQFTAAESGARADTLVAPGGAKMVTAGTISFNYQDKPYKLVVYWEEGAAGQKLFIPFRDATTNKETYGGGRYLGITLSNQPLLVDFNQAYHPYCVYDESYICPVPPRENTLPFAIAAGERL